MKDLEDKCPLLKVDDETKQEVCVLSGLQCEYKVNGNCYDFQRYKERMEEVDLVE
jgi:hypothetical protein